MNPNSNNAITVGYGSWNVQTGISTSERIIWKRRSNFHGYNIRCLSNCTKNTSIFLFLLEYINQNDILFNFNQCNESLNYRISSDVWPPSQTVVEDGCTSSECFKGTLADIFTSIQPILNFTFTVTKNGVAGIGLENGTWTGQIGRDKISDIESLNLNHFLIILR